MGKKVMMVVCPLCGLSRVLEKTGSRMLMEKGQAPAKVKGRVRFDLVDPKIAPFIDEREATGGAGGGRHLAALTKFEGKGAASQELQKLREEGKAGGFRRTAFITLEEAKNDPNYADLVEQIKAQIQEILDLL